MVAKLQTGEFFNYSRLFTDFVSRRHHDPVELTSFAPVKAISKCRIGHSVCILEQYLTKSREISDFQLFADAA